MGKRDQGPFCETRMDQCPGALQHVPAAAGRGGRNSSASRGKMLTAHGRDQFGLLTRSSCLSLLFLNFSKCS